MHVSFVGIFVKLVTLSLLSHLAPHKQVQGLGGIRMNSESSETHVPSRGGRRQGVVIAHSLLLLLCFCLSELEIRREEINRESGSATLTLDKRKGAQK